MQKGDHNDPKGLIFESFRIDGITPSECRTIFLDWALSLPLDADQAAAAARLHASHATTPHPMTDLLTEGLAAMDKPRRRGGWRSRARD